MSILTDRDVQSEWREGADAQLAEIRTRLDLLESNMEALPGIVAEAFISSFEEITWNEQCVPGFATDPNGNRLQVSGYQEIQTVSVDCKPLLERLHTCIESNLHMKINFDELETLRARVRELEEDLGYRRKVADRLMEPPRGNNK
jgi:hypothetical protein